MDEKPRRKPLNLRLTEQQQARLDALVRKYPMLNKHALGRAALERGLGVIETDPKWVEKGGEK